jgi:tetratricopeptide (TPR) repeat protein
MLVRQVWHHPVPEDAPMSRIALASKLALALLVIPAFAFADGGGMPSAPPSVPATPIESRTISPEEKAANDKAQADEMYAEAYRETDKAKQELADADAMRAAAGNDEKAKKKADEKAESAMKRFVKAKEKFEVVTTMDPKNADAWNMLGFTRRKLGNTQDAFDAYWKCLALNPEHFGAHEYMGEAYLQDGKLTEARAELTWLKKHGAPAAENAGHLDEAIAAWVTANPEAASKAVLGSKGASVSDLPVVNTASAGDSAR